MIFMKPAVYRDDFWGDLINTLLLRPVYRKPKPKPEKEQALQSWKPCSTASSSPRQPPTTQER